MKPIRSVRPILALLATVLLAACAETTVQKRNELAAGLPKPRQVNVYNFALNPAEIHENSGPLARLMRGSSAAEQTAEQMEIGREVADALATELTAGLRALGLNAVRANRGTAATADTILVTGAFLNIDEGNKARRTLIGLGMGQSSLDTKVSVLAPHRGEYRELTGFDVHTDSGSMPGAAVMGPAGAAAGAGTAAVIATNAVMGTVRNYRSAAAQQAKQQAEKIVADLSRYFARQGWVAPNLAK